MKRDRAAKAEDERLAEEARQRDKEAHELVLQREVLLHTQQVQGVHDAVETSESRPKLSAGEHVVDRAFQQRLQARELALDASLAKPFVQVPNVRASSLNNQYWQYEELVTLEKQQTQCQGCFPQPPWWLHGKPKPAAMYLVDKADSAATASMSSYATAYLKPTCSRFSLIRPPVSDWRANINEDVELVIVGQKKKQPKKAIERIDHAAEEKKKQEEEFKKMSRLDQELELMRREREKEEQDKKLKLEQARRKKIEANRKKNMKLMKLDQEQATLLQEYLQNGGGLQSLPPGATQSENTDGAQERRHPITLFEYRQSIQVLKEDDRFLDSQTLWCGNKAGPNGWCGLVHCQMQYEAERRAEIAAQEALQQFVRDLENDPLLKAELDARVATARGAWLAEFAEEIVAAKQRGEVLEFDPEPVFEQERNRVVVERLRQARKQAREKAMSQRPSSVQALDPAKHGGAARIFEIRIPTHGFFGHTDGVNCCSVSPNGRMLVTCSDDGTIKLWETMTGQLIRTIQAHDDAVRFVSFFKDSRTVVSASDDHTVRIWDSFVGEMIQVRRSVFAIFRLVCPRYLYYLTSCVIDAISEHFLCAGHSGALGCGDTPRSKCPKQRSFDCVR